MGVARVGRSLQYFKQFYVSYVYTIVGSALCQTCECTINASALPGIIYVLCYISLGRFHPIPPFLAVFFDPRLVLASSFSLASSRPIRSLGSAPQFGTPESEVLPPYAWRGRAKSGVAGETAAESAKWVDTRGLLSKIVDVFMREPTESLYRFWLASCVEAFLRGGR